MDNEHRAGYSRAIDVRWAETLRSWLANLKTYSENYHQGRPKAGLLNTRYQQSLAAPRTIPRNAITYQKSS